MTPLNVLPRPTPREAIDSEHFNFKVKTSEPPTHASNIAFLWAYMYGVSMYEEDFVSVTILHPIIAPAV
jgi:hypothetical protein